MWYGVKTDGAALIPFSLSIELRFWKDMVTDATTAAIMSRKKKRKLIPQKID